jgi:uncharacterized protein YjbJ (UPF0337 family)
MNTDVLQGMWKQIRGEVKKQWGNLTDDDLDKIDGQRDKFVGALQERYGWARAQAETELDRFLSAYNEETPSRDY